MSAHHAEAAARQGTYSIVALAPESGQLGVAVQSHWFSVGSLVPWAEPGVGAVATQASVLPAYGPRLLDRLRRGEDVSEALRELVAADEEAEVRQVAVVDAQGRTAVHTGRDCIPFAGHEVGEGFVCQANLMASRTVWPEMAREFASTTGELSWRLLSALEAAEAEGGDIRGRQSAAMVVVDAQGEGWQRLVDLRVEDHPAPLVELRRLLTVHRAYRLAGEGDDLAARGRSAEAAERYLAAHELAPDNLELLFWAGLSLVESGEVDRGMQAVRRVVAEHPGWGELIPRLPAGRSPGADEVRRRLGL
ncbi:MAG TPA: DUF1028 domain-containing protein [Candidatus Dormibacteraeota bacterium]|jgi:uncharacterized Ntn-hydrolase superfamily protein|nr:DUF1028 domain-containing protein [Candidatus Dormibacteraeota bacterium]